MKKSLVAVLLSLVALTVVAGAAFAGGFTVKATIDSASEAKTFDVKNLVALSLDIKEGVLLASIDLSSPDIAFEAAKSVKFALSEDMTLKVFSVKDKKLGAEVTGEISITENADFVLVASGDIKAAVKASVTYNGGSPEEKGNPTTVSKVSDKALAAATKKFPAGTKMFGADAFELTLTSKDYEAIKSDISSKSIKLYTTPANITEDGAVVFKITLKGINKNRLLAWFTMMLAAASGDTVSISSATEIGTVYYFDDDSGKEIMLNDTTTADDQTVDVAFEVKKGRQVFGVSDNDPKNGGGSPSSGCDMGLLGSLALFAVALLPLRKSR